MSEGLLQSHRKEKRELQAKIQKLKHSVNPKDSRRKKEVNDEIIKLTEELEKKHTLELCNGKEQEETEGGNNDGNEETNSQGDCLKTEMKDDSCAQSKPKKPSKAAKRRMKKEEAEKERERFISEQETLNKTGKRHQEMEEIAKILVKRGLSMHDIRSDGDCLYHAVLHQLELNKDDVSDGLSVERLREMVSSYMMEHKPDFQPFLTSQSTGDMLTDEEYVTYCEEIVSAKPWAGHTEIEALSQTLKRRIIILQADSPVIEIGNNLENITNNHSDIVLVYLKHMFGLGEHYNSVVSRKD